MTAVAHQAHFLFQKSIWPVRFSKCSTSYLRRLKRCLLSLARGEGVGSSGCGGLGVFVGLRLVGVKPVAIAIQSKSGVAIFVVNCFSEVHLWILCSFASLQGYNPKVPILTVITTTIRSGPYFHVTYCTASARLYPNTTTTKTAYRAANGHPGTAAILSFANTFVWSDGS